MREDENPIRPEEEKLAAEMPDPAGPPQPERTGHPVLTAIGVLGLGTVGVGLLLPMLVNTGVTMGATRSARIQWESRAQEIEEALQAEQRRQDEAPAPTSKEPTDGHPGQ
jgi:hypothetical protein